MSFWCYANDQSGHATEAEIAVVYHVKNTSLKTKILKQLCFDSFLMNTDQSI